MEQSHPITSHTHLPFVAPIGGDPFEFGHDPMIFRSEFYSTGAIVWHYFDTIRECDRHTTTAYTALA